MKVKVNENVRTSTAPSLTEQFRQQLQEENAQLKLEVEALKDKLAKAEKRLLKLKTR